MLAPLLRLVLALTLAFNGISAPMAMAHGAHAAQGSVDAVSDAGPQAGHRAGHAVPAHDGHQHGHGVPAADDAAPPDTVPGGGCCDGSECRCGCILPPAVPLSTSLAARQVLPQLPPSTSVGIAPSIALAAPFRPPSG